MSARYWREAASLVIIGRSACSNSINGIKNLEHLSADYEVLFLKRNSKSRFMPNAYVFPGGVVDDHDFSSKWIDFFKQHGFHIDDLKKHFGAPTQFDKFGVCDFNHQLPEMALRICALRETFEETGLIVYRDGNATKVNKDLGISELKEWRKLVQNNASQFLTLHEHLNVPPDIWSLYDWSSWLTPSFYGGKHRRFDTFFYVIFLDEQIPTLVPDKNEMAGINAMQPVEMLQSFYNGVLLLPPPQVYELGRLLNFSKFSELKLFVEGRVSEGMLNRWMPVKINTSDGFMSVLEGDDLYPSKPDYFGIEKEIKIDETFEESTRCCVKLNRVHFFDNQLVCPYVNLEQKPKDIRPMNIKEIFGKG